MKYKIIIRLIVFLVIFTAAALFELKSPFRKLTTSKKSRWINNLAIVIGNPLLLRLVFPFLAVDIAVIAHERGWGLLNIMEMHYWLEIVAGIILLDFVIYLQHVMFHAIPLFWRLHMMHHADLDLDLTTGLRFHPIEIMLSMCIKNFGNMCFRPTHNFNAPTSLKAIVRNSMDTGLRENRSNN